jgi:hypothetical protein
MFFNNNNIIIVDVLQHIGLYYFKYNLILDLLTGWQVYF